MNQQPLKLYSLMEPPPSGLAGLVVERVHGSIGQQLLDDPTFEPNVPEPYRRIAAASLETAYAGGYWIKESQSQKVIFTQLAYLLHSRRPANPCIALTFFTWSHCSSKPQILTLLLYNEFQQPLGLYLHESDAFVIYQNAPVAVASAFFDKERGSELIEHLRLINKRHNLEKLALSPALNHAYAFGFNKSFGHSHWNDVLGFIAVRHYQILSQSSNLATHCLLGQNLWLSPDSLINHVKLKTNDIHSCTEYLLRTQTCIHLPIGFSIGKMYEDFWRHEVTADIDDTFKVRLKQFRAEHWPIILFGLRPQEWWRKGWANQVQQVCLIIDILRQRHPNIGFVIDGLTAFHNQDSPITHSNRKLTDAYRDKYGSHEDLLDLDGLNLPSKVATYQIVDYGISQFGSGDAIPHWVYTLPSITISGESEIITTYSNPGTITRQCKPSLHNNNRCGYFMPLEHLILCSSGFQLRLDSALPCILKHLESNLSIQKPNAKV